MRKNRSQKARGKSLFRRINDGLHLWMGLTTGLIVCIVSITGCIYVFEKEIRTHTQPYQFVPPENRPALWPSRIKTIAAQATFGTQAAAPGNTIQGV